MNNNWKIEKGNGTVPPRGFYSRKKTKYPFEQIPFYGNYFTVQTLAQASAAKKSAQAFGLTVETRKVNDDVYYVFNADVRFTAEKGHGFKII